MKTLIDILKAVALVCFSALCISLIGFAHYAQSSVSKLNTVLDTSNKTVLLANKAINDSRLTLDNLNKAAIGERRYFESELPSLMTDMHNTILSANATITGLQETEHHLNATLDATSATVTGMQPVEAHLDTTLSHTEATVDSLNVLVSNPAITKSLVNIETATAAGALATQHAEGILADGKEKADQYTHPSKKKLGFWGTMWVGAQVIHKVSPPLF